jgi:hypothetical protein
VPDCAVTKYVARTCAFKQTNRAPQNLVKHLGLVERSETWDRVEHMGEKGSTAECGVRVALSC